MERMPQRPSNAEVAGAAAQLAGVIWILQWAHALVAHGPSEYNEERLWLGLTWMDSAKFLALSYLLLAPGVLHVVRALRNAGDRLAASAGAVVVLALIVSAVTTVMEFGLFVWGSYQAFDPTNGVAQLGGLVRSLTSAVLLTLGFVTLGIRAARLSATPYSLVPVLALGSTATVYVGGPLPPVPGLAWLVFGGCLLAQSHRVRRLDTRDVQSERVSTTISSGSSPSR